MVYKKEIPSAADGLLIGKTDIGGGEGIEIKTPEGKIIAGGGEIIINEKSSQKFCKELSAINQDGGGVAIDCNLQKHANKGRFNDSAKINQAEVGGKIIQKNLIEKNINFAKYGTKINSMENEEIEKLKQKMLDLGYTAAYGMLDKYEKESDDELLRVKNILESNPYWNLDKSERLSAIRTILKIRGVIKEDESAHHGAKINSMKTEFYYLKIGNLLKDRFGKYARIVGHSKEVFF